MSLHFVEQPVCSDVLITAGTTQICCYPAPSVCAAGALRVPADPSWHQGHGAFADCFFSSLLLPNLSCQIKINVQQEQ